MTSNRYTCAPWGCYLAREDEGKLRLVSLVDGDPSPSVVGDGWVSAVRDEGTPIVAPMVRKGWLERRDRATRSGDSFVRASWDEALDLAAGELRRVSPQHGASAIFGGSYGWASAGRFHHAQSQLKDSSIRSVASWERRTPTPTRRRKCFCRTWQTCRTSPFRMRLTNWPLMRRTLRPPGC